MIASVLPKPLEASSPTARIRIAVVDMGTGLKPFGAGWFGVRARHGDVEGEYALFMPMSTEQATTGGRETFGEPKKIGDVSLDLEGDRLTARIARMGSTVAELTGTVGPEQPGYEIDKLDFYFKAFPNPNGVRPGRGSRSRLLPPARDRESRAGPSRASASCSTHLSIRSPTSRSIGSSRSSMPRSLRRRSGEIVGRVPADWVLPFIHQRYDDLSVLGANR